MVALKNVQDQMFELLVKAETDHEETVVYEFVVKMGYDLAAVDLLLVFALKQIELKLGVGMKNQLIVALCVLLLLVGPY